MSTYEDIMDWLMTQLPMFQRQGSANYKIDLRKTQALMAYLDHPERTFKSIHVAGSNGKGSTSHIMASILQAEGLKVGLSTSPHMIDFRERIKLNGDMIPKSYVTAFVH
ncbi:MAG: bifunctional folylpolyglutamate synthase/dihydrofolate synthase, partial [Flavobacteriales bacterium]|nr:bifunctional folylpolyglutamate synthase/dihydrofolate synthase [Flavobacteriales bacterium]